MTPSTDTRVSAAFTPGPWEAWIAGKTICILGPKGDHHKPVIGWSGFDSCHLPLTKQKANAHLIAAAPELYEALANICASFPDDAPALIEARAALTKARAAS
jgi:hypothetical protein